MKAICEKCGKITEGENEIWKEFGFKRNYNKEIEGGYNLLVYRKCYECRRKHIKDTGIGYDSLSKFCKFCETSLGTDARGFMFCSVECYRNFHNKNREELKQKLLVEGEEVCLGKSNLKFTANNFKGCVYNDKRKKLINERIKAIKENAEMISKMVEETTQMIEIDILEGLTENQKTLIKYLVEEKGYNPMGFCVDVEKDYITYFGKPILENNNI